MATSVGDGWDRSNFSYSQITDDTVIDGDLRNKLVLGQAVATMGKHTWTILLCNGSYSNDSPSAVGVAVLDDSSRSGKTMRCSSVRAREFVPARVCMRIGRWGGRRAARRWGGQLPASRDLRLDTHPQ